MKNVKTKLPHNYKPDHKDAIIETLKRELVEMQRGRDEAIDIYMGLAQKASEGRKHLDWLEHEVNLMYNLNAAHLVKIRALEKSRTSFFLMGMGIGILLWADLGLLFMYFN